MLYYKMMNVGLKVSYIFSIVVKFTFKIKFHNRLRPPPDAAVVAEMVLEIAPDICHILASLPK